VALILLSCGKESNELTTASEATSTLTRNSFCGPEGNGCEQPDTLTGTFYNNAFECDITITMQITVCYVIDGNPIFQAIDRFIELYFIDNMTSLPPCGVSTVTTSRQIKMDCTRLCQAPSRVGVIAYRYVACSLDQGCCVQELEWCANHGVPTPSNEVNYSSPSTCSPSTLNCDGDPIPSGFFSTAPEPCGVRCDL